MEAFSRMIRGWLGITLLVFVAIVLVATSMVGYFEGSNDPNIAKTVNGQKIATKEVDDLVKKTQSQYLSSVNGDETQLNLAYIRQSTIDSLVARTVLSQQAEKLGISLSDAQLEQMIAQQPIFQENGKFSNTLLENYLRSIGMTAAEFLLNLRQDHALKMLVSSLSSTALVSQFDAKQIAQLQTEQRELHLASIRLDSFKAKQTASAAEVAAYYDKHKNEFRQVAKVDVDYVLLSPVQVLKANSAVTDAELKQAYDAYVAQLKSQAQPEIKHILVSLDNRNDAVALKRAQEIYAKIQAGMTFADAAKQFSDDTSSKNAGGVIAAYQPGVFSKEFDSAVAQLTPNQISKPVKTQYGYHLIETSPINITIPSLAQETPRLTAEIQKNRAATMFSDTVNRLNDAVVSSDSLQPVTQAVKATQIESVKGLTIVTDHPYLSNKEVKARLFGEDVKNGDYTVSSSILLDNGDSIWVKVRKYYPAGVPPLAEVNMQVRAKVIAQKAYLAAQASVANMLNDFKTLPANTVVTKYGYRFEKAGLFSRSQGLKPEIERTAFSLNPPKSGLWSVATTRLPDELVIVAVANVNPNLASITVEQQQQLAQLYQQMRGQQELQDYTEYLKSQAKIK